MTIFFKILDLLLITIPVLVLYTWSGGFKNMAISTLDELNEDEEQEEDILDEKEGRILNYIGMFLFVPIGILLWSLQAIAVGKVAGELAAYAIPAWLCYVLMYFFFIRLPFGIGNKSVKRSFDVEIVREKILFFLVMMIFYILAICCYDSLPGFMKWHLNILTE